MDVTLTEAQEGFRERARQFAADRLAPHYREREQLGAVEPQVRREMGERGFIAPELPADFGGRDLERVTSGVLTEEIAAGDFSVAYLQVVGSLVGQIWSAAPGPRSPPAGCRGSAAASTSSASACPSRTPVPTRGCRG